MDAGAGVVTGRVHREDTMLFDRILADVPCSGDGTMRKAPDIWRRWSVNNGNGLHNLQLRIALQAARLLKVRTVLQVQSLLFQPCKALLTDPQCGGLCIRTTFAAAFVSRRGRKDSVG